MKLFSSTPGIVEWTLPIFGYEYPLVDVKFTVTTYSTVRRAVGLPPCIRYEYVKGGRHTHENGEYYIEFRDGGHRRLCFTPEDCQEAVTSMEQAIREWQLQTESTLTMVKALQRLQPIKVEGSPYSIHGDPVPFSHAFRLEGNNVLLFAPSESGEHNVMVGSTLSDRKVMVHTGCRTITEVLQGSNFSESLLRAFQQHGLTLPQLQDMVRQLKPLIER